jgi:uncharacterized membrane protein
MRGGMKNKILAGSILSVAGVFFVWLSSKGTVILNAESNDNLEKMGMVAFIGYIGYGLLSLGIISFIMALVVGYRKN